MLGRYRWQIGIMLVIWGVGLLWFASSTMFERLNIDLDGQVISRYQGTYDTQYRIYVDYQIREADGKVVTYRANSNDTALSRNIPVGAMLVKKRWHFEYYVDGKKISDFPLNFYIPVSIVGLLLVGFGSYRVLHKPKPKPVDYSAKPWPYGMATSKSTAILTSTLGIDEIIDRLQRIDRTSSDVQIYSNGNQFALIRKSHSFNNGFRPWLFATVNKSELGPSLISYRIGLHPFVKGFGWFLVIFGILFSIVFYTLIILGKASIEVLWFLFPLIWLAGILGFIFGGRYLSRGDRPFLISFLQRSLEAHPVQ